MIAMRYVYCINENIFAFLTVLRVLQIEQFFYSARAFRALQRRFHYDKESYDSYGRGKYGAIVGVMKQLDGNVDGSRDFAERTVDLIINDEDCKDLARACSQAVGEYVMEDSLKLIDRVDVYLSHCSLNQSDHLNTQVDLVRDNLKKRGLTISTTYDTKAQPSEMEIEKAASDVELMILFITKEYIENVNRNSTEICSLEFKHCNKSKVVLPILLDNRVNDPTSWGVVGTSLTGSSYVDLTDSSDFSNAMNDLYRRISRVVSPVF